MCNLTIAVSNHSHSLSLRKREEWGSRKKWQRRGRGCSQTSTVFQSKYFCAYLLSFFQLNVGSFIFDEALMLQWVTIKKNTQKAVCVSDIAILSHPKHYSSTILPTWLVNTCVSMCKSECTHRLKLQFRTFSPSFDITWYASAAIYRREFLTCH